MTQDTLFQQVSKQIAEHTKAGAPREEIAEILSNVVDGGERILMD